MGHVMGHEMELLPKRASKKLLGNTAQLTKPQPESFFKSRIPQLGAILRSTQLRVERICHVIDVAGGKPGIAQAETDRTLWELMRVVEFRRFPVFDAIEAFL